MDVIQYAAACDLQAAASRKMDKLNKIIFSLYSAAQDLSFDSFYERALFLTRQAVSFDSAAILTASVFSDKGRAHCRFQDEAAFSERDLQFCSIILPHLFQAREINDRIFPQQRITCELEKISLVASWEGRIYFLDGGSIGLIQTE